MTDLLKVSISHLSTAMVWSFEAEEAWARSSDHVNSVLGALPVTETTTEVVDIVSEMPAGPLTTKSLPDWGTETTVPPTVDDARLPSPYSLERIGNSEHPQAAKGARVVAGVVSLEIVT